MKFRINEHADGKWTADAKFPHWPFWVKMRRVLFSHPARYTFDPVCWVSWDCAPDRHVAQSKDEIKALIIEYVLRTHKAEASRTIVNTEILEA